jgi:hypothetical protein
MTIMGPSVSLKQVGNDTNQTSGQLGGVHTRARLKGKKAGSISLKSLERATTAMCVAPASITAWNEPPTNTYQGFQFTLRGTDIRLETPSGDWTKDFRIGGTRKGDGDASFEYRQCGYAPAGDYRLEAIGSTDSMELGAVFSIAVACFDGGYFQGNSVLAYYNTGVAQDVQYNAKITIPAGKPYVAVVGYQYNYGPMNQEGRPPCELAKMYKATFTDARLGKV